MSNMVLRDASASKNLADSNKRISEVLEEEFEDGGCLADYDKNEVKHC